MANHHEKMTTTTHRQRHVELHDAFDELLADYLMQHRGALPSNTPIIELLRWSHEQTQAPTEVPQ